MPNYTFKVGDENEYVNESFPFDDMAMSNFCESCRSIFAAVWIFLIFTAILGMEFILLTL